MSDKSPSKAPPPSMNLGLWATVRKFIRRVIAIFTDRVPGSVPPPRGPR